MSLLSLPDELLLQISECTEDRDLNAFSQANWRLYQIANNLQYARDAHGGRGLALRWAAKHGLERVAVSSLEEGAEIDVSLPSCAPQASKTYLLEVKARLTPLQLAIARGHEGIARFLVSKGADVKRSFPAPLTRSTPLHVASMLGLTSVVELLIAKGARLEARDMNNHTPLQCAVQTIEHIAKTKQHVAIVRTLLEAGACHSFSAKQLQQPNHLIRYNEQGNSTKAYRHWLSYTGYEVNLWRLTGLSWRAAQSNDDDACKTENMIRLLLEAKTAALQVAKREKERERRKEKSTGAAIVAHVLAGKEMRNRQQQERELAAREANKSEALRKQAEAESLEAARIETAWKAAESIRLVETERTGRLEANVNRWAQLRQLGDQKAQPATPSSKADKATLCAHSSMGRLKGKGGALCENCGKLCRQVSYRCPDCQSTVCKHCQH